MATVIKLYHEETGQEITCGLPQKEQMEAVGYQETAPEVEVEAPAKKPPSKKAK